MKFPLEISEVAQAAAEFEDKARGVLSPEMMVAMLAIRQEYQTSEITFWQSMVKMHNILGEELFRKIIGTDLKNMPEYMEDVTYKEFRETYLKKETIQ